MIFAIPEILTGPSIYNPTNFRHVTHVDNWTDICRWFQEAQFEGVGKFKMILDQMEFKETKASIHGVQKLRELGDKSCRPSSGELACKWELRKRSIWMSREETKLLMLMDRT